MAAINHEPPATAEEEEQLFLITMEMAIQASLADLAGPAGLRPPPPSPQPPQGPQPPQPPQTSQKRAYEPETVEYKITDYNTMARAWQLRFGVDIRGQGAMTAFSMWWNMMKGTLDLGEVTDAEFEAETKRRERIWIMIQGLLRKDDEEKERRKRARIVRDLEGEDGTEKLDPRLRDC